MLTDSYYRELGTAAIMNALISGGVAEKVRFEFWSASDKLCTLDLTDASPVAGTSSWVFIGDTGAETITGMISPGGIVETFKLYNIDQPDKLISGTVGDLQSVGVDIRFNSILWSEGSIVTIQNLKIDLMANSISGNI